MKVYKFGGASVRDAAGVKNLLHIVSQEPGDLMVVVSAMGKTTNALERLLQALWEQRDEEAEREWIGIMDYHVAIAKELHLQYGVDLRFPMMPEIDRSRSMDCNYDQIVSLGEILSTQLVAVYLLKQGLPTEWWNMPKLLRTDDLYREARPDMDYSQEIIRQGWQREERPRIVVTQGFIGGTKEGLRTTLGREGSDYTAALMGYFLDAESVTIWKDVPGILNADPRLERNTVLIPELSYHDAVELSYSGAQIIHPKTIRPLENKLIPLYVRPFGDLNAPGSVICRDGRGPVDVPVYIWRKNQVLITCRPKDFGFVLEEGLNRLFEVVHRHHLKVSLIQSSAVTISVSVDQSRFLETAIAELQSSFRVTYNEGLSLLTIRGTTPEIIRAASEGRHLLLSQTTRRTARLLMLEK